MYDPKSNILLNRLMDRLDLNLAIASDRVFFSRLAANFYIFSIASSFLSGAFF